MPLDLSKTHKFHIKGIKFVSSYLNDILIFGTYLEEHLLNLKKNRNRLREVKLKMQIDKSCRSRSGHIFISEGVKPDPKTLEIVYNLKLPEPYKNIIHLWE